MTGFRTAIKNVRLKSDPDGKVHLVRVHKLQAGKSPRTEHAKAAKQAAKWKEKSK
jgi:hypothetical protein